MGKVIPFKHPPKDVLLDVPEYETLEEVELHSSIRWQVRHPCGCSDISSSIMPLRSCFSSDELVSTRIPGMTGVVQEAGVPGRAR